MELLKILIAAVFISACSTTNSSKSESAESLDIKQAEEVKTTASVLRPVRPEAVFNWQQYFRSPPTTNDRSKLETVVKELAKTKNPIDLLKRARNEVALGRYSAAEATYREILRGDRKNIDSLTELAAIYHRTRNTEACLQVLGDIKDIIATQEKPDRLAVFRYRYVLALALIQRGDRDGGHEILSDLIGQEKSFVPGYAALASSYISTGKDQIAKFVIERGLDRGQEDPSLYNLLGVISQRQGKLVQAREYFNRALALNDSFAPALVNRANIYIRNRDLRLAEGDLKKALEVDPLNTDTMISMAVVQRQTGRYELAKSQLNRVLEIAPESAEARYNLALLMRDNTKNSSEALRLFNEVSQTEKASPELRTLARSAVEELKSL